MKLIRLTSETNDGRFDNEFNDEITIKPNSKIALQSISVESDITALVIDGDNDQVEFEVSPGNTRTISLDHATYDEFNNHDFLNDLQLKLNQGLQYSDGQSTDKFRNELGFQMKVSVSDKGKVNVGMSNTLYNYNASSLGGEFNENSAGNSIQASGIKIASLTDTGVGRADSKHGLNAINPFTTGCGVFRVKIYTWVDDTSGATSATSGFEFGLCDSNPSTWDLPDGMPDNVKTYAIRGFQPGTNYYQKSTNAGNFVDSNQAPNPTTSTAGDWLEISIQGANIVGTIFQATQANGITLFTQPYEVINGVPKPLFGYILFHGSKANIELYSTAYTPDPFISPRLTAEVNEELFPLQTGANPLDPRANISTKKIDFKSSEIASFLGFNDISNSLVGQNVLFIASILFIALIENDALLILLENLPLESYDGFKKGRKSILASVPNPNAGSRIVYEPNNLNYIELNNANEVSLRNIRAKILYQDYTPLKTRGLSVLNVLLD